MAQIKYTGLSHFRELAAADFKKLGVEGQRALVWARGEVKEVSDDVANALHTLLGTEFQKVEADAKAAEAKKDTTSTSSSSSSSSTPPASSPASSSNQ